MLVNLAFALVSFVVLYVVFRPLELESPAWPGQRFFRPGWLTDLAFFLGQHLIWLGIVMALVYDVLPVLHALVPPALRRTIGLQPLWLQFLEVIVLGDLVVYWGHRLQHRVDFLWRFHAVHHSAEHLDWLAAHREHPVDTIYSVLLMNLPAYLLGIGPDALVRVTMFRGLWSILIHSNIRYDFGLAGYLLGSPAFHHWHHAKDRHGVNFGNNAPWLDVLFGTHHDPGHEPRSLGLEEPAARSYVALLVNPLLPRRFQLSTARAP